MLEKDVIIQRHSGCPNRHHCPKDEKKCCYLLSSSNKCYLESEDSEVFL